MLRSIKPTSVLAGVEPANKALQSDQTVRYARGLAANAER